MKRADILAVAAAYASRDTWGVEGIYLPTLVRLLRMPASSIPADRIVAHAGYVGRDCCPLFSLSDPHEPEPLPM
jgi:hypothetical protein